MPSTSFVPLLLFSRLIQPSFLDYPFSRVFHTFSTLISNNFVFRYFSHFIPFRSFVAQTFLFHLNFTRSKFFHAFRSYSCFTKVFFDPLTFNSFLCPQFLLQPLDILYTGTTRMLTSFHINFISIANPNPTLPNLYPLPVPPMFTFAPRSFAC